MTKHVKNTKELLFQQVCNDLARRIAAGEFPVGSRLPTESALIAHYHVSITTVRKAVQTLSDSGIVEKKQGSGTYVTAVSAATETPQGKPDVRIGIFLPDTARLNVDGDYRHWMLNLRRLNGIYASAAQHGCAVFVHAFREDPAKLKIDGAICMPAYTYDLDKDDLRIALTARLNECHIPFVTVSEFDPRFTSKFWVAELIEQEFFNAVNYLTGKGHRRIALLGPQLSWSNPRYAAYRKALDRAGIPFHEELVQENPQSDSKSALVAAEGMLDRLNGNLPDAILCTTDLQAYGVLELLAKRGIRVPDDVSVMGVDNLPESETLPVPLTSLEFSGPEIGGRALELLLAVLSGQYADGITAAFPGKIHERASVRTTNEQNITTHIQTTISNQGEKNMMEVIEKNARPQIVPCLDKDFVPAVLWDRAFQAAVKASGKAKNVKIVMERSANSSSVYETVLFDNANAEEFEANLRHVERLVKSMFWLYGGHKVTVAGDKQVADAMAKIYDLANGERKFDSEVMGGIYSTPVEICYCDYAAAPAAKTTAQPLGRHLGGCRIGFDLGGSDRKAAALIDGKVVFSEEIPWDPYFQKDPSYHKSGIEDSLKRAAAHLPRVDAVGGSTAGVMVQNRVRISSLFRGVPKEDFESKVANIFVEIAKDWKVPFEVVNDGEVTALAGSMQLNSNSVLGVSLGTSMAGGYVNPDGNITDWLNELAFVPVDYRENGPADEWSGDLGCGVQYFSQQGVARLAPLAGIEFPADMKFPERLKGVQKLMEEGDPRAEKIYRSIGVTFGYTIARFCDFYPEIKSVLFLGRVTSGKGGDLIQAEAENVIKTQFPEYKVAFEVPDEQTKRHGQAIAAASLPMA